MRTDIHTYYMQMAKIVASRSTCLDKHVGCVLVDDDRRVVACGYNGSPSKALHCTDLNSCAKANGEPCRALHAEANALQYCKGRPLVCYCTLEPCTGCAKLLRNAGVKVVYFAAKTSAENSGRDCFKGEWIHYSLPQTSPKEPTLDSTLEAVRKYHKELGLPRTGSVPTEVQFTQAREIMLAMFQEVAELTNSMDWKPWKKYGGRPEINQDNLLEEAGDILFFIDSLLMNFNLSWQQVITRMDVKLEEVNARLTNGYHN